MNNKVINTRVSNNINEPITEQEVINAPGIDWVVTEQIKAIVNVKQPTNRKLFNIVLN